MGGHEEIAIHHSYASHLISSQHVPVEPAAGSSSCGGKRTADKITTTATTTSSYLGVIDDVISAIGKVCLDRSKICEILGLVQLQTRYGWTLPASRHCKRKSCTFYKCKIFYLHT